MPRLHRFLHGKQSFAPQRQCESDGFITAILPQIIGVQTNTGSGSVMLNGQILQQFYFLRVFCRIAAEFDFEIRNSADQILINQGGILP
jgi:hypothetical protein